MKDNYCTACGRLVSYGGDGDFICEYCGAHNNPDGSCSTKIDNDHYPDGTYKF